MANKQCNAELSLSVDKEVSDDAVGPELGKPGGAGATCVSVPHRRTKRLNANTGRGSAQSSRGAAA